ncbi:hypothetical protein PI95_032800 [Hassallia byssoidea VB512170]|uniref:Uncharacterized protein n=1 Tax=Hassallia byssoidea VB512170 TaxID=1304833 RepID=A0A846HJI9_9CYAN|nr:hypothetical protein [Hassalia byssoidea VB512170]
MKIFQHFPFPLSPFPLFKGHGASSLCEIRDRFFLFPLPIKQLPIAHYPLPITHYPLPIPLSSQDPQIVCV